MNFWHFSGRLGRDAELRTTQSGEKVLSFAVANDVGYGERKTTQWVDCALWGRRGDSLQPHLKRGMVVHIAGELRLEEFESKGVRDKRLSVRVIEIDFGSSPRSPAGADDGGGDRGRRETGGQRQGQERGGERHDDWRENPF